MNTVAKVKYLRDTTALAEYRASVAGGELIEHKGEYSEHSVGISDARQFQETLSLDKEGFRLVTQNTQVTDFYNDAELNGYEKEIENLVKSEISAREVVIFDHTRRSSSAAIRVARNIREASNVIHNDYSAQSGRHRLADYFATNHQDDMQAWMDRPFAIVNVWRSSKGTIEDHSLTFCHADSVASTDLVSVKRVGAERVGEIQLLLFNSQHKWSYFPALQGHEALLFKTYDSREKGYARFTPHTAFADPQANKNAAPRESIETRCFAFY